MPPRIDSLSNHQVNAGQHVRAQGTGFDQVVGVQVGTEWATNVHADGGVVLSFEMPEQAGGSTAWVVVHCADGSTSPCEGDAQLVIYDSILDAPAGELTLTSLTPETVVLGREDTYWLVGTGLSKASAVVLGNHAPAYEAHDDTRLVLTVPAMDGRDDTMLELTVWAGSVSATLQVPCTHGLPDPLDQLPYTGPGITSLHPESLPAAGGELRIDGVHLDGVTTVCIGPTLTLQPYWATRDTVIVTVPSLAEHVGEQLGVEVIDANYSSGTGNLHQISVTA